MYKANYCTLFYLQAAGIKGHATGVKGRADWKSCVVLLDEGN